MRVFAGRSSGMVLPYGHSAILTPPPVLHRNLHLPPLSYPVHRWTHILMYSLTHTHNPLILHTHASGRMSWASVALPFWEIGGFGPHGFQHWWSKIHDLTNWYSSLPTEAVGIIRIGQRLVCSVSELCDWVGYQVMVLAACSPSAAAL